MRPKSVYLKSRYTNNEQSSSFHRPRRAAVVCKARDSALDPRTLQQVRPLRLLRKLELTQARAANTWNESGNSTWCGQHSTAPKYSLTTQLSSGLLQKEWKRSTLESIKKALTTVADKSLQEAASCSTLPQAVRPSLRKDMSRLKLLCKSREKDTEEESWSELSPWTPENLRGGFPY